MMAISQEEQSELNKGSWAPEEDEKLKEYMKTHGETRIWKGVPKAAGLNRNGKSCRMRWTNYLRSGIKRGNISKDEEDAIITLYLVLGPRWSLMAAQLGRTENEIKNHFHTRLKKKVVPKDKVPPKLHPDVFTWNPRQHGLGFNPTLPAQTLSSQLPPFNYPATEDPQFNNNHPEVQASLFPNVIPNPLFPNPTLPAQALSGLPLPGADHFNNHTIDGPAQSLLSLPLPGAYHFYDSGMEDSQFNNNHPEVQASLFPNVIPNALFPNPTLPAQALSGLPPPGADHFNNHTIDGPAQSLLSLPLPGAYHFYDSGMDNSQFNNNHPEVQASLFPNVIPNPLFPNPTLPAQALSGLPLPGADHFNNQTMDVSAQSLLSLPLPGAYHFYDSGMEDSQFNNNHPEVQASLFPNVIPNALFPNPTLPAQALSGLPLPGADHFNNQTMDGSAQSLLSLPLPGAYHFYDSGMEDSQFNNNHPEVQASLFPNVIPNALFPNPTLPAQALSGLPLPGADHFNNQTMDVSAQSLLSLPLPGACHFYDSGMEDSQFNNHHPEVQASLFPNVIPNALFPNPTLPAQALSGLPLPGADHFNNQSLLSLPLPGAYHFYDSDMEHSQFNNHPEVNAPSFHNVTPNALVSEPCMSTHQMEKITSAQAEIPEPFFTSTTFELAQRAEELILGNEIDDSFYKELKRALE